MRCKLVYFIEVGENLTDDEEKKLNTGSIIEDSSEHIAEIIPAKDAPQAEGAENTSEDEVPLDVPAFQAQPLEIVAKSATFWSDDNKSRKDAQKNGKKSVGFWVFCFLIGAVVLAAIVGTFFPDEDFSDVLNNPNLEIITSKNKKNALPKYKHDYIARIDIKGTIQEKNETYNHKWLLNMIDNLMNDNKNKGLFLFVDSPGGAIYEADELYLKLCDYKSTGRPIYSYFSHMAASGGYYTGCVADYIMANRNCTTGSIGVIMGPIFTFNELFKKYGIEATSITAGKNKNMLNINEPITAEQRKIMQEYIDEAYDQFTEIVAKERNLPIERVRELADGRIYSAKQALAIKLIDKVCGYDEAVEYTKRDLFGNNEIAFEYVEYVREKTFSDIFPSILMKLNNQNGDAVLQNILERMYESPRGISYFYNGAF